MLIAPELRNSMGLVHRLEKLETSKIQLTVRLMIANHGFIIGLVDKKQHIKIYVEPNHHMLITFMDQYEKYDTEIKVEDDADLDALSKQVMGYLQQPHDLF